MIELETQIIPRLSEAVALGELGEVDAMNQVRGSSGAQTRWLGCGVQLVGIFEQGVRQRRGEVD